MTETSEGTTLEKLVPGAVVSRVVPQGDVTVVAVAWHGTSAITLTYRTESGQTGERLLYRTDEPSLRMVEGERTWAFDGDGELFRLVSEARRIRLAHLFDPMLALHLSQLEPLPHQIQAVYGEMLPRQPLRFALCDDPGSGKTIMAGLYIKELTLRGDLERCLIVVPGSLATQWQDELYEKFALRFDIFTREHVEASLTGNPFAERDLWIARLDQLSRNELLRDRASEVDWDLVVFDEAHKLSAHFYGSEVDKTKRYQLGEALGASTRHLLLMTATPHAGKEEDFQLWLALLDADRFEGRFRDGVHTVDTTDLMRRMIKEDLLTFDGKPLFPERRAYTIPYPLSDFEMLLYREVTSYVVEEMNRADRLREEGEGRRGNRVGFALTVLQRRLASSPQAIHQSLSRRRKRLENRLHDEKAQRRGLGDGRAREQRLTDLLAMLDDVEDIEELEDLPEEELEALEEEVVDEASTARTIAELEAEIATLAKLEELAARVRGAGTDRKWQEFSTLLDDRPEMRDPQGNRRKLIVFTEHKDTLEHLVERLRVRLGRDDAVVFIHGGVGREERRAIHERFTQDENCVVLVATDAAGEGINLQRAHLVVNYDLPWNPNRIEQRFGRVHRIGQQEVCHMWNLVAHETREGAVYRRLLDKLEQQQKSLHGQVFDVLGEAFQGEPLRDLLMEAIRYGNDPHVRARLDQVIDERVGEGLGELVAKRALTGEVLGIADVEAIRHRMEEAAARRLQPHFIRAFFLEGFSHLGGRAIEREPGRFKLNHVPANLRARDRQIGRGAPLLQAYERVCFDKSGTRQQGAPLAELVAPGHPLLDVVVDVLSERYGSLLRQGAVLVDETDDGDVPRVLVALEHRVVDGRTDRHGNQRTVSRRMEYVSLAEDGTAYPAGPAPYLDLRPATDEERSLVKPILNQDWLGDRTEERARDVAIGTSVPEHLAEIREYVEARINKVLGEVHRRLTAEIQYWDHRATELRLEAEAGKQPKMNPDKAAARAEELSVRLQRRTAELEAERQLQALPPTVAAGALVVPVGLLVQEGAEDAVAPPRHAVETERVERRAVEAVLATERALGRDPTEMPRNNPGYDIRSIGADGHLLFVEVKGRISGAESFTVTRNEILYGLNAGDRYLLALVEVSPDGPDGDRLRYVRHPYQGADAPFFGQTTAQFDWRELWERGVDPLEARL